ncbi:hypothetical protein BB559_003774, partial [Furculomyces boomerangus]
MGGKGFESDEKILEIIKKRKNAERASRNDHGIPVVETSRNSNKPTTKIHFYGQMGKHQNNNPFDPNSTRHFSGLPTNEPRMYPLESSLLKPLKQRNVHTRHENNLFPTKSRGKKFETSSKVSGFDSSTRDLLKKQKKNKQLDFDSSEDSDTNENDPNFRKTYKFDLNKYNKDQSNDMKIKNIEDMFSNETTSKDRKNEKLMTNRNPSSDSIGDFILSNHYPRTPTRKPSIFKDSKKKVYWTHSPQNDVLKTSGKTSTVLQKLNNRMPHASPGKAATLIAKNLIKVRNISDPKHKKSTSLNSMDIRNKEMLLSLISENENKNVIQSPERMDSNTKNKTKSLVLLDNKKWDKFDPIDLTPTKKHKSIPNSFLDSISIDKNKQTPLKISNKQSSETTEHIRSLLSTLLTNETPTVESDTLSKKHKRDEYPLQSPTMGSSTTLKSNDQPLLHFDQSPTKSLFESNSSIHLISGNAGKIANLNSTEKINNNSDNVENADCLIDEDPLKHKDTGVTEILSELEDFMDDLDFDVIESEAMAKSTPLAELEAKLQKIEQDASLNKTKPEKHFSNKHKNNNNNSFEVYEPKKSVSDNKVTQNWEFSTCERFLIIAVRSSNGIVNNVSYCNEKLVVAISEETQLEVTFRLQSIWTEVMVSEKDTVNVLPAITTDPSFDKHSLDNEFLFNQHTKRVLILHPDVLVSATMLSGALVCNRRAFLKEKFKSRVIEDFKEDGARENAHSETLILVGNLVHELFQWAALNNAWTFEQLELAIEKVVYDHIVDIWNIKSDIDSVKNLLIEKSKSIVDWGRAHMRYGSS